MLLPPAEALPLRELAFAVVDLETTGGSPKAGGTATTATCLLPRSRRWASCSSPGS